MVTWSAPVGLVYCEKHNLKVVANLFYMGPAMGAWPPAKNCGDSIIWGEKKNQHSELSVEEEESENELSGEKKEE